MNIAIVGTGYVGLVTGTCFAETGVDVTCVDVNADKIANLQQGIIPIYEPGLEDMVLRNVKAGRLHFTTSLESCLDNVDIVFSAVGTPPDEDGSADLRYVLEVAKTIGANMKKYTLVVTKSTVPVGTARKVKAAIREELEKRGESIDFDVASNPEFLKEGNAIDDFMSPDRMELIEVSGYITEEKVEIARRHLVPKELEANGIKKEYVKFSKAALECIVENYTRESGVRELEKKINKVMRKIALEFARDGYEVMHEIKPADVRKYLGTPEYSRDKYQGNEYAGVVTGLAWTAVGGEILFVETSLSKGKGGKLTLTGNLGDVMKESAMLALEYLKAHTKLLNLQEDIFDNWNIHIHVPEGAIPKDGPSAGITMVTSLASALTQRKVKANLAMTGEITLRGKVLPVGGIKEKILAAKRAGIKDIILCEENRKNIEEIQPMYLEGLTFHYVTDIKEVLALALTNEKVNNAIDFNITNQKTEEKK